MNVNLVFSGVQEVFLLELKGFEGYFRWYFQWIFTLFFFLHVKWGKLLAFGSESGALS